MVSLRAEGDRLFRDWPARCLFIVDGPADSMIRPTNSFLLCAPITSSQTNAAHSAESANVPPTAEYP